MRNIKLWVVLVAIAVALVAAALTADVNSAAAGLQRLVYAASLFPVALALAPLAVDKSNRVTTFLCVLFMLPIGVFLSFSFCANILNEENWGIEAAFNVVLVTTLALLALALMRWLGPRLRPSNQA
jgi:nitrate/nitrite transporter NarK